MDEHTKISSLVSEEIMALKESVSIEDAERGVVASDQFVENNLTQKAQKKNKSQIQDIELL